MIPSAEAVLASLLLRPEALGGPCNKTIYAVGSEEVRALIVIEISSFLSNLAAQDCEFETSTDFFSNSDFLMTFDSRTPSNLLLNVF